MVSLGRLSQPPRLPVLNPATSATSDPSHGLYGYPFPLLSRKLSAVIIYTSVCSLMCPQVNVCALIYRYLSSTLKHIKTVDTLIK